MRIVLIHRYFWPDTPPYAHILREIALHLGEAGHDVTVLTCQPSYDRSVVGRANSRERLAPNVEVRRWPVLPDRGSSALKVLNLIWFCSRLLLVRLRLGRVDVVMAASTPPIAVGKAAALLARRCDAWFVYHKQDIYPEVVTGPGILPEGRRSSFLRRVDSATDRAADRVVVLSDDMAATTKTRGVWPHQIAVINNFDPWSMDDGAVSEAEPHSVQESASGLLKVVFAGNLGRFQNLETIADAAALLRDENGIEFHLFGSGALAESLARRVAAESLRHVHLHGYRSPDEVAAFLRTKADIGIVSLAPGVVRAAFPSKTMSYLRHGCPVLALVEPDCGLAKMVEESGAGFQVDPTDAVAIAALLRRLSGRPSDLRGAGKHAADLYVDQFSQARQLGEWSRLFDGLQAGTRFD
jgi:glycosyltransferase involved in cell wall biosynthesis